MTQIESTTPTPPLAPAKPGLFTGPDGKSLAITFILVSTLFLLWGFCNGMIDVMDKHFQDKLHLSRSNSAWVQFAHYLGYFIISIPAGWLARKLGYRGGIVTGLFVVALGGLWFVPATFINTFPAFLFGVCLLAMGLTFLETVANPYTTVLGPKEHAARRINLAQSANGIGWIAGPIAGTLFFYNVKSGAAETAVAEAAEKTSFSLGTIFSTIKAWFTGTVAPHQETLFIPYLGVAIVVIILAVVFMLAKMPNIKTENVYEGGAGDAAKFQFTKGGIRGLVIGLVLGAIGALAIMTFAGDFDKAKAAGASGMFGVFFKAFGGLFESGEFIGVVSTFMGGGFLCFIIGQYKNRPHVAGGVISQFFYVAAQAGIFSFFINYMVSDTPPVPQGLLSVLQPVFDFFAWLSHGSAQGVVTQANGLRFFTEAGASTLLTVGFFLFFLGRLTGSFVMSRVQPAKLLGIYAVVNAVLMILIFMKLGWLSFVCLFLSFFFMSIMFPTIFSLGIHGLGEESKTASSFIVMAILGGAIMPKLMGWFSDHHGHVSGYLGRDIVTGAHANTNLMTPGFIVPLFCFVILAIYGFAWEKLSGTGNNADKHASE